MIEANKLVSVHLVAGCVIKKQEKFLLIQEKQPRAYGLWNFPAGKVDEGETLEQAAAREAKEETGFEVRIIRPLATTHREATSPVLHSFEAEIIAGELKFPEDEILDAQWFSLPEIEAMKGKLRSADWILSSLRLI